MLNGGPFTLFAVIVRVSGFFKRFFMELNGERVASAICFDYGKARLLYNSGFNPAYSYYSVGLLLKALEGSERKYPISRVRF